MRLFRTVRYYWRFLRLVIRAGAVWGVRTDSVAEWREQVRATPLKYELEALEEERAGIVGKLVVRGHRVPGQTVTSLAQPLKPEADPQIHSKDKL
jgi:hypothetical protein